jgi:hypothetical protein
MAHYLLRWQLRDGSRTAFGETVSAMITGKWKSSESKMLAPQSKIIRGIACF